MNLIVVHKNRDFENNLNSNLLQFVLTDNPVARIVLNGFIKYSAAKSDNLSVLRQLRKFHIAETLYVIPKEWSIPFSDSEYNNRIIYYSENVLIPSQVLNEVEQRKNIEKWFVISNGRFFSKINNHLLKQVMDNIHADVVVVNAVPELLGEREKVRLTKKKKVVGFRRFYTDSVEFTPVPDNWPHHLFIRAESIGELFNENLLPLSFSTILDKCKANALRVRTVNIGGVVLDLEKEKNLLRFCRMMLLKNSNYKNNNENSYKISSDSKLTGKVLLGKDVQIGSKSIVIGPTIIGDNVIIEEGSVINSSIIGSGVCVHQDESIHNRVIQQQRENTNSDEDMSFAQSDYLNLTQNSTNEYRIWPKISYSRLFKRVADILVAMVVLILFAPLIPFIAAAIKLTSSGSVFYKDKRQGLHGKEFNCLKFRTMLTGADKIQKNLRFVSQVDGPQFKMDNDPRISGVGRFLRETYIDEIPQFFNVLLGQMSVVGPRPSPKTENTLCPFWRDARLSVRPGITGLWQIYRTRRPMKDFQEWIYYDTEYVRNLSLKMDLMICWKTAKKLIDNFISQF